MSLSRSALWLCGIGLVAAILLIGGVAAASPTTVSLTPADVSVVPQETTSVSVVVEGIEGGVGAYNATVGVVDPSVASIKQIELRGTTDDTMRRIQTTSDGSHSRIRAALLDTADSGTASLLVVTLSARQSGTTDINLSVTAIGDENGASYSVSEIHGATIQVKEDHQSTGPDQVDNEKDGGAPEPTVQEPPTETVAPPVQSTEQLPPTATVEPPARVTENNLAEEDVTRTDDDEPVTGSSIPRIWLLTVVFAILSGLVILGGAVRRR